MINATSHRSAAGTYQWVKDAGGEEVLMKVFHMSKGKKVPCLGAECRHRVHARLESSPQIESN